MKYIDANKLIAEIERRLKSLHEWKIGWERRLPLSRNKTYYKNFGKESAYDAILNIITSLQQEQPEVESLIRCELPDMEDDKNLGLCYCNQFGNHRMTSKDVQEIARHFYELGLKARKEESK